MNIKKILKILSSVFIVLFIIYLIYAFTLEERVLLSIQIENYVPIFAKLDEKDTHSGFRNEGELLKKIYFSERQAKNFIEQVKKKDSWREVPMTERLSNKVCKYAMVDDMNIPEVDKGYWFVLDRHSETKDKYNEKDIFDEDRHSYNFTVAVFDTDKNILYVYELDT